MSLSNKTGGRLLRQYGPWALVTGATSGIGLELATLLAGAGFHLVITARGEAQLASVQQQLKQQFSVNIKTIAADLATSQGVEMVIDTCSHLPVGLLVASAGYGTSGLLTSASADTEVNMLRVNCEAVLMLTHHFGQQFKKQQRGGIILLSSIAAFQGMAYSANYAATKAYVQTLAEGLHYELKPYHVDVLAVAPGPVATGFGKRSAMDMRLAASPQQVGVPILRALGKRVTVRPGALALLMGYSLDLLPRWARIWVMGHIMGRMAIGQK